MNRKLYPKNWNAIAMAIKVESGWRCENCAKPCKKPDESWEDFEFLLESTCSGWLRDYFEEIADEESGEWGEVTRRGRFILTVAHLDQNPANNARENLKALCSVCHLRHDAIAHAHSRKRNRLKRIQAEGQQSLFTDGAFQNS